MGIIKISHEVPLVMLKESLNFNDYQYCLVHLLEESKSYLKHFEECRDNKIPVLLDNSLFELGEAFTNDRFAKFIRILKPNQYVIPDVFNDYRGTIRNVLKWKESGYFEEFKESESIGVIQGNTYEEYVKCYKSLDESGVDVLAISFGYDYYSLKNPYIDKNQARMFGRITLINRLIKDKVINPKKKHHLLGAGLPQEFMFYKHPKFHFIKQLDTSSPIIHGMHNIRYMQGGLIHKLEVKLADELNTQISETQMSLIYKNIDKFRKLIES